MKVVKKTWIGTGSSPNKFVLPVIEIAAGKRAVLRIDAGSSEGKVNRVYVKQIAAGSGGGTSIGFTVRVHATSVTYGDGQGAAANYNAAVGLSPEPFDLIDALTVTAGNKAEFRDDIGSDGRPFIQEDSDTQSGRGSYLYLVIIPNNALDATKWEATVVLVRDIG